MVTGLAWVGACAVSVALSVSSTAREEVPLRDEIRAALAATLPARGEIDDAEGRHLLALFQQLAADEKLPVRERQRLTGLLESRLVSAAEQAHRRAKRAAKKSKSVALSKDSVILAQQQPPAPAVAPAGPPAAPGAAPPDAGDDLARLIVATIAPQTWQENGGNGSIYYYRQWQCLVVRQTDDIHRRLGRLVVDLRQP